MEGGSSEDAEDAADEGKVARGAEEEGLAVEWWFGCRRNEGRWDEASLEGGGGGPRDGDR